MASKWNFFGGFGASSASVPSPSAVSSPWAEGSLSPILASDIFGIDVAPVTRDEAMRVGAVVKGRAVLHSLITPRPLVAYRGTERLETQPTWLYRSDSGVPVQTRTALILDDLIFNDSSLLYVSARGADGSILDAVHVSYSRWSVMPDGTINIDGKAANADDCIWIQGPWPGLLAAGSEKIRESRNLERSAAARARNPIPTFEIHVTGENPLEPAEAQQLAQAVATARRQPDGAVIVTPSNVDLRVHGDRAVDYHESARNAVRLDFASYFGLPSSLLESGVAGTSLEYSTQEGKRSEVFDYAIQYWSTPIQAWLSQDRVTPRGTRIAFDFSDLLNSPQTSGPALED